MPMFLRLAVKSLLNRRGSVLMSLLAISVAIFVLLGIEHIRQQARTSFASTVSGVDLIVGAKTGSTNLLLYSVFRIGAPTDNISWQAYQAISSNQSVAWSIPISLGDSHQGYRVIGTTDSFFEHFSYGKQRSLSLASGKFFEGTFDAVLGAEVAQSLGYEVGQEIVLAHGVAATSFTLHENRPFTVVGILAPTGTPVDKSVHVPLDGIEAMHATGGPAFGASPVVPGGGAGGQARATSEPASITAFMLGLHSRLSTFKLQREINSYPSEPLLAILPGVALAELWQMMGMFENVLRLISALVLLAAVLGLGAVLLASIRERRHEISLLRVLGAPPYYLFLLIELEALLVCLAGVVLGVSALSFGLVLVEEALFTRFGLYLDPSAFTPESVKIVAMVAGAALLIAAIPAFRVYSEAKLNEH